MNETKNKKILSIFFSLENYIINKNNIYINEGKKRNGVCCVWK